MVQHTLGENEFAWHTQGSDQTPLVGFSHGASGIALALARAGAYLDVPDTSPYVYGALQFERRWRDRKGYWPDLRKENQEYGEQSLTAWCHGAAGVALARKSLIQEGLVTDKSQLELIRSDLSSSANDTVASLSYEFPERFLTSHCLCHGRLGNMEGIYDIARFIYPDDEVLASHFSTTSDQIAGQLVSEIAIAGSISGIPQGLPVPGLMTGLSGIAVGVLRTSSQLRKLVPSPISGSLPLH